MADVAMDDESLVEHLLTVSKTQADAAQRFVNDYGNVSFGVDDERHPANWSAEQRQQMARDAETLRKLGRTMDELVQELVRRREAG